MYKSNVDFSIHQISFTTVNKTNEQQEVLLKVYAFSFISEDHEGKGTGSENLDFTEWFSFEINSSGEITRVYHESGEHHDVLIAKKGFASLLSSKLQAPDNTAKSEWTYKTEEYGNEGHHNASYSVVKTKDGIQFKKFRHSTPIPNAKGVHQKVLHFDHDLGTVKRVVVEEEFTSPQMAPNFDAGKDMRKVKAMNDFSTMENPTMSATNKGVLTFLKKELIKEKSYRPVDGIVTDSIHIGNYEKKEYNAQKIAQLKEKIKKKIYCIRIEPAEGSPEVVSCFHSMLEALTLLPDDDLKELAKEYFVLTKPNLIRYQEETEIMIDAFASLSTNLSQILLAKFIIYSKEPKPVFVIRLLSHIPTFRKPPHQSILLAIEDLCFNRNKFPQSLYTGKLYQRALLTLGIVVNQLSKAGDQKTAAEIIEKVHQKLGLHDPWSYKVKRATQTTKQQEVHDHWNVVLLETLGNAGMDSSYDYIVSHVNTTNSPWIKRAGLNALRKYEHEMVNIEHSVNESSIVDPYASDIIELQGHQRHKRGFWDGLEFKLSTPSVDWQKKLCYKGDTSYNFNIFQEGNGKQFIEMIFRFDKVIKDIVNGIKSGVDLFKEIISGKGIKGIIDDFIAALESLPQKVADLRSRAKKAVEAIGKYDESQLPAFLKPVKSLIHRVEKLFNDIKTDVMTFYNKLDELINVKLPVMGDQLYQGVIGIIEGFRIIGKNPKSSIFKIGLGVYQVYSTYKEALKLKNQTQEACFFLKDEKPYWWNISVEYKGIVDEAEKAIDAVKKGSPEWIEDFKEDPVATFTKGKNTTSQLRETIKNEIITTIEELMNPFRTILRHLAGPFFEAYETVFGVIKSVKEAYSILKKGYQLGKSLIDSIFGTKAHPDFPRTIRLDTDGCRGKGFYPSMLMSGDPEYSYSGVDLEIVAGEIVVAPFSGYIMLTDNPNEVLIKADESLKNTEIYITNVDPKDTILHPSDENYIEHMIWGGVTIGTATSSPCKNHIHLAIKKDGGFAEPTRFLESRPIFFQPYVQHCNDYKLEKLGYTVDAGKIPPDGEGQEEVDETPDTQNTDVTPIDPPAESDNPGTDIQTIKDEPKGMFSKVKSTVTTGIKLIDNRPCLNPAKATEEELKQELFDRGHATTGTREQMISRLTRPDNRVSDEIPTGFDVELLDLVCLIK
ncbi:unnamed protein product [Mytilus coruscus]|uniref:SAP domain-containing protein n=1 Tax=Mytilus coruscus TaxID=42192 RepID=A0A6J8DM95_MYTCO|nr:unnamed protein product [Mytilus coruscus]